MLRRFQQQHLANLTNYRWLKYASLLWSLRIACIAIAVTIPLLSQLVLLFSDSSHNSVLPSHDLPVYEAANFTPPASQYPYIIRGVALPQSLHLRLFEIMPSLISPVKSSTEPFFQYFATDKPWSSESLTHNTSSMFFTEFMRRCYGDNSSLLFQQTISDNNDSDYYYYSHAAPKTLLSLFSFLPLPKIEPEVRLWFSSPNTIVQPHYDMEHNYFLQLTGSKSFLLASPDHSTVYSPHSYLHTQWRQAQNKYVLQREDVITLGVHAGLYNSSAHAAGVYHVTLEAGDALFIPAFYYHTVFAHSDSISLNAWIGSAAYDISQKLLRIATPFHSADNSKKKIASIFVLMKLLCIRLLLDVRMLHRDLVSRYEGICRNKCENRDETMREVKESIDEEDIQLARKTKRFFNIYNILQ